MTAHAKKDFRPTLETLENREMMDAGIGRAVMHRRMPDIAQGAQVRLLTQEPSALQNPNNPLSQSWTQANQAFLGQAQQPNANAQAAADRIFTAWSQHVHQVVHHIPGLQDVANRIRLSAPRGDDMEDALKSQMTAFLKHEIMGPFNSWGFNSGTLTSTIYTPSEGGNTVEMSFSVLYYSATARRSFKCNIWLVFHARTEGDEKVYSLTRAGLDQYRYNSDTFEGECLSKFQKYFDKGIHISQYKPTEVDKSNVVRAASSQFMRDIVGKVVQINDWAIVGMDSATGTIQGSTIQVELKVMCNKAFSPDITHPTFHLSFQLDHRDPTGGKYFKIVGFQCNDNLDGKEALRDRVMSAFTASPVCIAAIPPKAAEDIARRDFDHFKAMWGGWAQRFTDIKSYEPDSVYADQDHLYVCIKLTREVDDHNGKPIMAGESTLIIDHKWNWCDGGLCIQKASTATVETCGRLDLAYAVLMAEWKAESSIDELKWWHKYDKDGSYQGDTPFHPTSHAALEAQVGTAPAVEATAAPLAGLAPQTSAAPPGAFSPGAAKPAGGATGLSDLTGSGPTDGIPPQAKTVTMSSAATDAYFAAAVHPSNPGGTDAYFAGQARFGPDGF